MPCFSPWRSFTDRGGIIRQGSCGKCEGCLKEHSRQWAVRCLHESKCHEANSFVTLTYEVNPEVLDYEDFRLFLRRVRRSAPVRYFAAGEFGELRGRPHWHALLFGRGFQDLVSWGTGPGGSTLYRSAELEKLWPHGFSSVGDVTFASASYVARYVLKKYSGAPGFARMSRMPGIGSAWFDRYQSDFERGKVVVDGVESNAPRFYMRKLKERKPFRYREVVARREAEARVAIKDAVPGRVEAVEKVFKARVGLLKRSL